MSQREKGKDPVSMYIHPLKDRGSYIVKTKLGQGELQKSQELRHEGPRKGLCKYWLFSLGPHI